MRLPVPGPRDLLAALEKGADQVEALLGAVPRVLALLDDAELLLVRASSAVDQVEAVTRDAAGVVVHADAVVDRAEALVAQSDPLVARLATLLDALEPSLTTLQPTLETLADTTNPDEVAALVRLIDHLPELTERVERDVLPVMTTLGTVAPDIHDLLAVSRELNDMLAKLPGLGRIKRRIDEQQGEDDTTATVRD
ncbi:hypothetical protein [Nocardioides sp. P5_C9_2]